MEAKMEDDQLADDTNHEEDIANGDVDGHDDDKSHQTRSRSASAASGAAPERAGSTADDDDDGRRSRSRSRSRTRSKPRATESTKRSPRPSKSSRSRSRSRDRRRRDHDSKNGRRRSSSRHRESGTDSSRRRKSRSPMSSRKRHLGDRERPEPSTCLGIFGLSLYTRERDLEDLIERHAPLDKVQIVYDRKSNKSRGFGFAYFRNVDDASKVREALNGIEIDRRQIRCDFSVTKRAHTPTPGIYMGRPTEEEERRDRGGGGRGGDYGRSRGDYGRRSRDRYDDRRGGGGRPRSRSRDRNYGGGRDRDRDRDRGRDRSPPYDSRGRKERNGYGDDRRSSPYSKRSRH